MTQFRSSSHQYNIEPGRYGGNRNRPTICWNCPTEDKESLELLCELPTIEPIIEDELHVLTECSLYDDIRSKLKQTIKSVLEDGTDLRSLYEDPTHVRDLARFPRICHVIEVTRPKGHRKSYQSVVEYHMILTKI